jgi:hypothetical protein
MSAQKIKLSAWVFIFSFSVFGFKNIFAENPACAMLSGFPVFNEEALPPAENVIGENVKIAYSNADSVNISDKNWKLKWNSSGAYDKYGRSAILIRDVKNVIINNISIDMLDSDYRASHGIFVEKCDRLDINNVRVRGSIEGYAIRADECKEVYIDGVEISGIAYNDTVKSRAGGGIYIAYGNMGIIPPLDKKLVRIKNCFIHDYHEADTFRNHDGINIESPLDVVVSDCLIKNWGYDGIKYAPAAKAIDAAIDISYRIKEDPIGKIIIEKNVFLNSYRIKTPGTKNLSTTAFKNNIFLGTGAGFYHNSIVNFDKNIFLTDNNADNIPFRLWGMDSEAEIHFENNVFSGRNILNAMFYANSEGVANKTNKIFSKNNFYALPISETARWLDYSNQDDLPFSKWLAMANISDASNSNIGTDSCIGKFVLEPLTSDLCEKIITGKHYLECSIVQISSPKINIK